jgi:hypothetical protein
MLGLVGALYLWLAFQSVAPGLGKGDWVSYLGAFLFLAAGAGATFGALNLLRPKRR